VEPTENREAARAEYRPRGVSREAQRGGGEQRSTASDGPVFGHQSRAVAEGAVALEGSLKSVEVELHAA
jgi:hypothetical protein